MDGLASLREIPSQNFSILHGFEKTFLCASFSYHFPHLKAPSDRKGTAVQGYCLPTFLMEKGKPYGNTNVSLSPGRCKEEIMTIHIAIRKDRCLFSQLFEPVSQVLCLQEAFADAMSLIPQALRGERVLCLQLAGRKPRRHGTKERLLVLPEMSCDVFDELCPLCLGHGGSQDY